MITKNAAAVALAATVGLLLAGCSGSGDEPAKTETAAASTSAHGGSAHETDDADGRDSDRATSSGQASPSAAVGAVGEWEGTWRSQGEMQTAELSVSSEKPFRAKIDIDPQRCGADWRETSRSATTITVAATVTYGDCTDNAWILRVSDTQITATDPANDTNAVVFHRD